MPTYVSLINFTQQGIQSIKELPARVEKGREDMRKQGIEMKSWHLTMGQYDIVAVIEAPSDEAAATFALSLGAMGNARTQTMRAFSLEDLGRMVQKIT
jgi:uncharacterized protein with GYD domain